MTKTKILARAAVVGTTATLTLGLGIGPAYSDIHNNTSEAGDTNGRESITLPLDIVTLNNSDDTTGDTVRASASSSDSNRDDDDSTGGGTSAFFGSDLGVLANTVDDEDNVSEADEADEEEEAIQVGSYIAPDHTEGLDFEAHIVISTSEEAKSFTTSNEDGTIAEILEDRGVSTTGYRDAEGNRLEADDLDRNLAHGETLLLHSHSRSVDSEEITLEHRVEEVETDDLYIGETEVEQEGSDGSGLSITLTSGYNGDDESVEERLTVIEAPQREILLVGTAERPEPTFANGADNSIVASTDTGSVNGEGRPHNSYLDDIDVASFTDEGYETGHPIVDTMLTQIDNRYVWGAQSPSAGFDCSGLIWWAYQQNGKSIPRIAEDQGRAGTPVSWDNIEIGDFIWSDYHIGIYMGEDENGTPLKLHALNPRVGIIIDDATAWKDRGFNVSRL